MSGIVVAPDGQLRTRPAADPQRAVLAEGDGIGDFGLPGGSVPSLLVQQAAGQVEGGQAQVVVAGGVEPGRRHHHGLGGDRHPRVELAVQVMSVAREAEGPRLQLGAGGGEAPERQVQLVGTGRRRVGRETDDPDPPQRVQGQAVADVEARAAGVAGRERHGVGLRGVLPQAQPEGLAVLISSRDPGVAGRVQGVIVTQEARVERDAGKQDAPGGNAVDGQVQARGSRGGAAHRVSHAGGAVADAPLSLRLSPGQLGGVLESAVRAVAGQLERPVVLLDGAQRRAVEGQGAQGASAVARVRKEELDGLLRLPVAQGILSGEEHAVAALREGEVAGIGGIAARAGGLLAVGRAEEAGGAGPFGDVQQEAHPGHPGDGVGGDQPERRAGRNDQAALAICGTGAQDLEPGLRRGGIDVDFQEAGGLAVEGQVDAEVSQLMRPFAERRQGAAVDGEDISVDGHVGLCHAGGLRTGIEGLERISGLARHVEAGPGGNLQAADEGGRRDGRHALGARPGRQRGGGVGDLGDVAEGVAGPEGEGVGGAGLK